MVRPDGMVLDVDGSNQTCSDITPGQTSCTFYITEDGDYSVMFTESNEIDTKISPTYNFNCRFYTKHLTIMYMYMYNLCM